MIVPYRSEHLFRLYLGLVSAFQRPSKTVFGALGIVSSLLIYLFANLTISC